MFNDYYLEGPLYILINRLQPKVKFLLHFPTNQYMDSHDWPVTLSVLEKKYPDLFNRIVTYNGPTDKPELFIYEIFKFLDKIEVVNIY